jgi:hypothetical protein
LPFVAREATGNSLPQKYLAVTRGRQTERATIGTRHRDVSRADRVVESQPRSDPLDSQPGDAADATVEVIEPREELRENRVGHVGVQGQLHPLTHWLCFSHTKKSAIELSILEAAGQHVGHMCFQTTLT